jgi:HEAT repeat protein
MAADDSEEMSFEYEMPSLDVPAPPEDLAYSGYEDFRTKEILTRNGISLSEDDLVATLERGNNILQAAAAHTLGSLSCKSATPTLKRFLASSDDLIKAEAAYALARLGDADGKDALVKCLDYPLDAYLCPAIAAGYLAQLGDPQGYPIIVRSFDVDIAAVRMLACKQLYFFVPFQGMQDRQGNTVDVLPLFARALKDSDDSIQWQALVQLRQVRLPDARAILESYVGSTADEQLRQTARGILGEQVD